MTLFQFHKAHAKGGGGGGEITNPFLYLVYVDGLIRQLEASGYGTCIAGVDCSSLSIANDMVLVSFSKFGLQMMMEICFNYSIKWHYMYNPSKCLVIVFNLFPDNKNLTLSKFKVFADDKINVT